MNPFPAIEVALHRRDPDLSDDGTAWIPEERVTLEQMLRAYTLGGAEAGDMEDRTGTVSVGKDADLIVVDRNLLESPAPQLSEVRVDLTVFRGTVVHRR